jgi:YihY family inner membrane protein
MLNNLANTPPAWFKNHSRKVCQIIELAVKKYIQINGNQSAAAFAHFAFFSLFPLTLLFVSVAALFIDREQAGTVIIAYIQSYIPIGKSMQSYLFDTLTQVVNTSGSASIMAILVLIWSAMQFFTTLIMATNQAWGDVSGKWWQLPLQSLMFLALLLGVLLLGITLPLLIVMLENLVLPELALGAWFNPLLGALLSPLVIFLSLSLFYRIAPTRNTRFAEVWAAALCTTVLLQAAGVCFAIYMRYFTNVNAVYGALGGIMSLLLWIYVSGCIFIFGACLSAVQNQNATFSAT